jgi:hypothetical protein
MADNRIDVIFGAVLGPLVSGVNQAKEEIESIRAPVQSLVGGLQGLAEAAGAAFVIDKIAEWGEEIFEAAEQTKILAEGIGVSVDALSRFQNLMLLAGGSGEVALRIFERMEHGLREGITKPLSDAGQAIRAAGINLTDLGEAISKGPLVTIELLRQAWQRMADNPQRLDIFGSMLGGARSLQTLMPYLVMSQEELNSAMGETAESGANLSKAQIQALTDSWEKVHELELAFTGLKDHILLDFKGPIDASTESLKAFIEEITGSGAVTEQLKGFFADIKETIDETKTDIDNIKAAWQGLLNIWAEADAWIRSHSGAALWGGGAGAAPGGNEAGQTIPLPPKSSTTLPDVSVTGRYAGNAAVVADALDKVGASANAVSGILQNLTRESGINPGAVNPRSGATGIAQWLGDRLEELKATEGPAWTTLQGQVDFLIKEFQGQFSGVFKAANAAATGAQAEEIVRTGYEKPGPGVGAGSGAIATGSPGGFDTTATREAHSQEMADLEVQIEQAKDNQQFVYAQMLLTKKNALMVQGTDSFASAVREQESLDRAAQQAMARNAEQAYATRRSIDQSYLAEFEAKEAAEVSAHRITKQQEYGFDAQYTGQLRDELAKQLQAIINNNNLTVADHLRATQELLTMEGGFNAKITEDGTKAAEAVNNSWTQTIKSMSDQMASAATDIILGTKSIKAAFTDLVKSLLQETLQSTFKGLFNSLLFGSNSGGAGGAGAGGAGGAGGGIGGGIGSSIGGSLLSMLGGDAAKGLIGNPFSADSGGALGGIASGLFGGGAGFGLAGAGGAAGDLLIPGTDTALLGAGATAATRGGGIFSSILAGIGSLFAFSRGGIVPSAAGGWSVPSLGSGSVLAQLHSNEMVLPSNISQGLQGMIAGGGGGGHTFNVGPISAVDAPSVARLFMSNGSALVTALQKAVRNGSGTGGAFGFGT